MQHYLFGDKKTEEYFISQCGGWVKELYDLNSEIKTNRFLSSKSNKGIVIQLIRDDSYYSIYKIELNLGFNTDGNWRYNLEDNRVKNIDKVIVDFGSTINKLPIICTICGCSKDKEDRIIRKIDGNQKDRFLYEVIVDDSITEKCNTCNFLFYRDEFNIHLFNMSKIYNNEFILPDNRFVNPYNENLSWSIVNSTKKIRVINQELNLFEYLSEKCFVFDRENLLYKTDFHEFSSFEFIHLNEIKGIKKGIYAGQNTGFKDINDNDIFTGDVIRFKWKNIESCGVVSTLFIKKEFHVLGNFWSSSLSELLEMEIFGNIFFDLDRNSKLDIISLSKRIGEYGFDDCKALFDINRVKNYLSSKVTPSFKRRNWFKLFKF
jgi:hypothetical protein